MQAAHPNTLKAQVRALLAVDRVVTTAQLQRWGLLRAAEQLELPTTELTCRTRVTHSDSVIDLTFVALLDAHLDLAPRELMHLCGLAEARRGRVLAAGEHWQHVSLKGRAKGNYPDAEIVRPADLERRTDWAVEFDAGYAPARIAEKLEAAAAAGYTRILWATSIHDRTRTVTALAARLHRQGRLPGIESIETRYVNFWTPKDPYINRPRCHKQMVEYRDFRAAAG